MTRPEDIPEDVWDSSAEVAKTGKAGRSANNGWGLSDGIFREVLRR